MSGVLTPRWPDEPLFRCRWRAPDTNARTAGEAFRPRRGCASAVEGGRRVWSTASADAWRRVGQYGKFQRGSDGADEPGSTRKTIRTLSAVTSMRLTSVQMMLRLVDQSGSASRAGTIE